MGTHPRRSSQRLKQILCCLLFLSTLSPAGSTISQSANHEVTPDWFANFLARASSLGSPDERRFAADSIAQILRERQTLLVADSTVYFIYYGNATRVSIPSDLNGWNPAADTMERLTGTSLFSLRKHVDPGARFEYKFVVDSTWILDPLNTRTAAGGYGLNSEVRMPGYLPPPEIEYVETIPHGRIDTVAFASRILGRTHPLYIYVPPGYATSGKGYPLLYVTDGGEYLALASMNNVLDNLIHAKRISPIIVVFIDPRTNPANPQTSKRMVDYMMNGSFVSFLTDEIRPFLLKRYRLDNRPGQTGIMGASLGGLIATYAAVVRSDIFGLCAAQSPAYQVNRDSIFTVVAKAGRRPVRFYIDTGTIRDAQAQARRMKTLLESEGYPLAYGEYPESHNWVNWRARVSHILTYFWGTR